MKNSQLVSNPDSEAIELILCKISSAVCETERISENFNELKKRYEKALRELNLAIEVNRLLTKKIDDLKCREAVLMGHLRRNSIEFGEEEMDDQLIN